MTISKPSQYLTSSWLRAEYLDGFLFHASGFFIFLEQVVGVSFGLGDDSFEERKLGLVVDELGSVGLLDDFFLLLDLLFV